MEFIAGNYILTIEENMLTIDADPGPRRTSNLFYVVLFLWFGYLFAKRILKIQTSIAFNWFMVLLFGAMAAYYFTLLVIRFVRKKRRTKYPIHNIKAAGVIEEQGNNYAVCQMKDKKFVTINFSSDLQTAQDFISALYAANNNIALLSSEN